MYITYFFLLSSFASVHVNSPSLSLYIHSEAKKKLREIDRGGIGIEVSWALPMTYHAFFLIS